MGNRGAGQHLHGVIALARLPYSRANVHGEGVFPLAKILPHRKLVRDQHVFAFPDLLPIQIVFGQAIHSFEHEEDILPLGGGLKAALIPPFMLLIGLGFSDVFTHIKVARQIARLGKVKLNTARHGGR